MSDASSEPQYVRGEWSQRSQPLPSDFVTLVAQVTAIGVDVKHLAEDQRDQRKSFDQFIVEHRSQHMEDRTLARQERNEIKDSVTKSVTTQLEEVKGGRRIYIGLIATGIGAVVVDILMRVLDKR